ncbi:MAG: DUF11 domain-containing protein, partial [Gallionella sp.]|nr:DUF11 domain-containing protein [Gallionella sp.]
MTSVQKKALLLVTLFGLSANASAISPANSPINNIATANYSVGAVNFTRTGTKLVNTTSCFAAEIKIDLLQYIPASRQAQAANPNAFNDDVQASSYSPSGSTSGPFIPLVYPVPLPTPATPNPAAISLPANLLLAPLNDAQGNAISQFTRNEPIFVRVISYDGNLNGAAKDTIAVTVKTTIGGDSEVMQLTETGISTGVFIGAIPSTFLIGAGPTPNNGSINISAHNETITANYNPTGCGASGAASSSSGLIDPYGIVFDSTTGAPINGATVSLVNSAGAPVTVYCDDGVTPLIQPITSGSPTNCDASVSPGGFRFPLAPAGSYKLVIVPPGGYVISTKPASALPVQIGTPPSSPFILGNPATTPGGSYGGLFTLWGPALKLDIPLDKNAAALSIVKATAKTVAFIGDLVPYTVTVTSTAATMTAQIVDTPPGGFIYKAGSATLNGVAIADPLLAGNGSFTFSLNNATSPAIIAYQLEVTPAALLGAADNMAAEVGNPTNAAHASVLVQAPVLTLQKSAAITSVSAGDLVPYTVTVSSTAPSITAQVEDTPPAGFIYKTGTASINGTAVADPVIAANGSFIFSLTSASNPTTISYQLEVTPAALLGAADNIAAEVGNLTNAARASVTVNVPVLTIEKIAEKTVASTGDFVPYTLNIKSTVATINAQIADHPPVGFRYQKGSARLNGTAMADPIVAADTGTLTFSLTNVPSPAVVRYVLEITPAAHTGTAENTAAAISGATSNTAHATVLVREELFRNKSILIGRVIDGSCDDQVENDETGLANARILLQDGTYALTDKAGRWHIDNVRPGTHVVQLDLDSLPKDYEVVACEKNDRFAGRSYSQFVNLRAGSLWRADFHVQKKAPVALRLSQTLSTHTQSDLTIVSLAIVSGTEVTGYSATIILPEGTQYIPGTAKLNDISIADPTSSSNALTFRSQARPTRWQDQYTISVEGIGPRATIKSMMRYTTLGQSGKNLPVAQIEMINHAPTSQGTSAEVLVEAADSRPAKAPNDDDNSQLMDKMAYDEAWLTSAQPGVEWLHPQEDFHPNLPVVNIAVKHAPQQKLTLTVNGASVNPLLYDGAKANASRTVTLSTWRAVPVTEGDNKIELVVSNADGSEFSRTVRNIHYAATPDHVEFIPALSRLVADGKTRPIVAVRFLDKDGVPVRRGINGEFVLGEPYRSYNRHEAITRNPLTGTLGGKPHFEVMSDGMAMIELEPTTQSGEAVLNFQFNNSRKQELRAWLEAGQRDWILVGFGEGTLGHKSLSGNMQVLQAADAEKELFDGNKLAFYAKGSIKGDFLLTLAYDTSKQTGNKLLKQAIDPTQYYTLYADAMQAGFDAASSSRLYVKLERKQFYAMFGDYDTGLTVTELSRYSRTLNGVKSSYKGEQIGYNAFASITSQAYLKDEIPGNGTSGVYKLSRGNLVVNSDKIRIETRDRFQSQIIVNVQTLTRYLDYNVDYDKGTLTFHEPINSRDSQFNPIYIVAEYESADPADSKATAGGRASVKATQQLEIGATLIHEGTVGATGNLKGIDATLQLDDKTKLRGEIASSNQDHAGVATNGNAALVEVKHHEAAWDANAYLREQQGAFGVGQQAASESSTRKMGVDGRVKLSERTQLKGQAYQQTNLTTDTKNSVIEGRAENHISENLNAYYGARSAHDQTAAGDTQSNQIISGAAYTTDNKKLTLRAAGEVTSGTAGSANMPNRATLGSDYKLTEQTKVFAEQEFARGERIAANTSRFGLRTQPWTGGEMSASIGQNFSNDSERIYNNLGLVQRWQINEHWQTDFSLDRTHTLKNTATSLNLNTPLASGSGGSSGLPSTSADYTASAIGGAYNDKLWGVNGRIELRNANDNQQRNLLLGMQRSLDSGRNLAAGYTLRQANGLVMQKRDTDLRLSYAHRPNDGNWVWFDRGDYITQNSQSAGISIRGKKLINNLHANYMPNRHTQISLQYGAKYVLDTLDNNEYKGYTDLFGAEIRHDLTQRWDIGAWGSVMTSHNSGVRNYGLGTSVGFK